MKSVAEEQFPASLDASNACIPRHCRATWVAMALVTHWCSQIQEVLALHSLEHSRSLLPPYACGMRLAAHAQRPALPLAGHLLSLRLPHRSKVSES